MDEYIKRETVTNHLDDCMDTLWKPEIVALKCFVEGIPSADVATVRHGRCPVCSGQEVLAQDCDNGYSVEIDAESQEMTLWNGDTCLAAISVDYCPVCGARMDGAE